MVENVEKKVTMGRFLFFFGIKSEENVVDVCLQG